MIYLMEKLLSQLRFLHIILQNHQNTEKIISGLYINFSHYLPEYKSRASVTINKEEVLKRMSLARSQILLVPGNRAMDNVEPCTSKNTSASSALVMFHVTAISIFAWVSQNICVN